MLRTFLLCGVPLTLIVGNVIADDPHQNNQGANANEVHKKKIEGREPYLHLAYAVRTQIEMTACEEGNIQQLQEIYDMMRKLDPNNTGRIDPNALKAGANQIRRERVQRVFQELDVNRNGKITREEARGLVKEHFDRIDKNKDGFITLDELLAAAKEQCEQNATHSQATDHQRNEERR
jgi:Asp-tRNA(Asn)/Glu-tRNA(Gln) amidotransferase C subunit